MALPKLDTSKYELEVPSTGEKVLYRPYLVKEEKILMLAMESEDTSQMIQATKDVIRACTDNQIDVDQLTMFDLEFIFITLRSKSSGESANVGIKCEECGHKNEVPIHLDKIYISEINKDNKLIKLTDKIQIEMKYPDLNSIIAIEKDKKSNEVEKTFRLIAKSIDSIYHEENVFSASEQSEKELMDFIDQMNSSQFEKIKNFVEQMPQSQIDVEFICESCNHENNLNIKGLQNFFR